SYVSNGSGSSSNVAVVGQNGNAANSGSNGSSGSNLPVVSTIVYTSNGNVYTTTTSCPAVSTYTSTINGNIIIGTTQAAGAQASGNAATGSSAAGSNTSGANTPAGNAAGSNAAGAPASGSSSNGTPGTNAYVAVSCSNGACQTSTKTATAASGTSSSTMAIFTGAASMAAPGMVVGAAAALFGALMMDAIRIAGSTSKLSALPALNQNTRSETQPLLGESNQTLLAQIFTQRVHVIAKQWILTVLRTLLTFGSPYCVMRLVTCLEDSNMEDAWAWLFGIALSSTFETVVHYHQNWIQWSELGIPIRAQLITAVYRKLLRKSAGEETSGSLQQPREIRPSPANSLLASDATTVSKFAAIHYILPLSVIQFLMALAFIKNLLGWQGMLITLLATVASMPINTLIVKRRRNTQKKLRKTRDQKDRVIGEMIRALHHIKLQGTEDIWKQRVKKYRDDELRAEARDFHAQAISFMWKIASPLVISGVSIFTYAYLEGRTTASVIFTILELLPQLQGTLGLAPLVVQDYLSARTSSRRIESFLRTPDKASYLQNSPSGDLIFKNATFAWVTSHKSPVSAAQNPSSRFKLDNVNVHFPVGKLSIVHGDTGSGKSLLLAAMLGEAELSTGVIKAPCAVQGSPFAFVTQTPWLQSMSIKDNILFGESFNKARYNSVLEACALIQDLEVLANGDETLMGPQGVKVSGGQRARISLARALYSEATVILMDDILSALDTHVARHVLDALDGPLGAGRTRILATHQLELCKPKADYVVRVVDGTVLVEHLPASDLVQEIVVEPDKADWELVSQCNSLAPNPIRNEDPDQGQQNTLPKPKAVLEINELSQAVYWTYIEALGGLKFILVYFLALAIRQVLITLPTWALKNATLKGRDSATHKSAITCHAGMFTFGSTLAVIAEYLFNVLEASGNLRASEALFNSMLDTVVHMPLAWLHNVSTGDLIQRFSTDSQAMDDRLMALVSEFSQCFIEMMTIIVVGLNMSLKKPSPPPTAKGAERLTRIVATMKDRDGEEAPVLLKDTGSSDHTFRRTPGYISALKSPGLLDFLRRSGIKSLVLAGLSTSGCLLRTAIPATEEDFVVTVVSDGCADPVDGNHDFLIEKILPSRAHVLTASQLVDGYGNRVDA
ncbi:hypothetical protein KCU68_g10773, partial [Aureobasidium melanogenum]